ncbi:MAG: hypothetical protein NUW37_17690 [Planctomycetes bacterium]|nr:hypothetical protein [Planctomycetota bacterium]
MTRLDYICFTLALSTVLNGCHSPDPYYYDRVKQIRDEPLIESNDHGQEYNDEEYGPIPPILKRYSLRMEIERVEHDMPEEAERYWNLIRDFQSSDQDIRQAAWRKIVDEDQSVVPILIESLVDAYWIDTWSLDISRYTSLTTTTIEEHLRNPEHREYTEGLLWERCLRGKLSDAMLSNILFGKSTLFLPTINDNSQREMQIFQRNMSTYYRSRLSEVCFVILHHPLYNTRRNHFGILSLLLHFSTEEEEVEIRDEMEANDVPRDFDPTSEELDPCFHPLVSPPTWYIEEHPNWKQEIYGEE